MCGRSLTDKDAVDDDLRDRVWLDPSAHFTIDVLVNGRALRRHHGGRRIWGVGPVWKVERASSNSGSDQPTAREESPTTGLPRHTAGEL